MCLFSSNDAIGHCRTSPSPTGLPISQRYQAYVLRLLRKGGGWEVGRLGEGTKDQSFSLSLWLSEENNTC